jgi:hypothetical protein
MRKDERPPDIKGSCEYIEHPTRGGPPALRLGEVLATPHHKNGPMLRNIHKNLGIGLRWLAVVNAAMKLRVP